MLEIIILCVSLTSWAAGVHLGMTMAEEEEAKTEITPTIEKPANLEDI